MDIPLAERGREREERESRKCICSVWETKGEKEKREVKEERAENPVCCGARRATKRTRKKLRDDMRSPNHY